MQAHTVRGKFAGSFKKNLCPIITSTKDAGCDRVYRIGTSGPSTQPALRLSA